MRFILGLLDDGVLDGRRRELAILCVAWLCQSDYVWKARGILAGPPEEATILTAIEELAHWRSISPDTWRMLARRWDEKKLIELLTLVRPLCDDFRFSQQDRNRAGTRGGRFPGSGGQVYERTKRGGIVDSELVQSDG